MSKNDFGKTTSIQDLEVDHFVIILTQTNIGTRFKHGDLFQHRGEGGGSPRSH